MKDQLYLLAILKLLRCHCQVLCFFHDCQFLRFKTIFHSAALNSQQKSLKRFGFDFLRFLVHSLLLANWLPIRRQQEKLKRRIDERRFLKALKRKQSNRKVAHFMDHECPAEMYVPNPKFNSSSWLPNQIKYRVSETGDVKGFDAFSNEWHVCALCFRKKNGKRNATQTVVSISLSIRFASRNFLVRED